MLFFNKHMATPPSSLPLWPELATPTLSTLKKTGKATWLKSFATKLVGMERLLVHVDPATRKVDGPYRKKSKTYLGIIARDKIDVTIDNWKQVYAAQKDLIDVILPRRGPITRAMAMRLQED